MENMVLPQTQGVTAPICPPHTECHEQQTMARFKKGEHLVESETMVAYKRCIADVAEREAFIELSMSLCAMHPGERQFSQASLSDALETTAKLL